MSKLEDRADSSADLDAVVFAVPLPDDDDASRGAQLCGIGDCVHAWGDFVGGARREIGGGGGGSVKPRRSGGEQNSIIRSGSSCIHRCTDTSALREPNCGNSGETGGYSIGIQYGGLEAVPTTPATTAKDADEAAMGDSAEDGAEHAYEFLFFDLCVVGK
ncbi:hypothetical protein AYI70_g2860 [Smittium culicis]|uniref:Uncharacterized protein n=1 Tax=Smittium culicis TaxID=133412 RepID=A0A1R1Y646_9FUNG|nr:hypothetical protein AYI70_g2860 [Smittium culicis]